jgi:hypothetical protein
MVQPTHQMPSDACLLEQRDASPLSCGRRPEKDTPTCRSCKGVFGRDWMSLSEIKPGATDKLGNRIKDVLWAGEAYVVYRTWSGVFVHFSDCRREERAQRHLYDLICVRLCQLRFLANEMAAWLLWRRRSGFLDHAIAQSIVLTLQGRCKDATEILDISMEMAAARVKDDNRARYLWACISLATIIIACWTLGHRHWGSAEPYMLAATAGAWGAAFSIAARIRDFEFAPCRNGPANYLMGALRVLGGAVAGAVLLLLLSSDLISFLSNVLSHGQWPAQSRTAAMVGFIAGFAERLVPNLLRGAEAQMLGYQKRSSEQAREVVADDKTTLAAARVRDLEEQRMGGGAVATPKASPPHSPAGEAQSGGRGRTPVARSPWASGPG